MKEDDQDENQNKGGKRKREDDDTSEKKNKKSKKEEEEIDETYELESELVDLIKADIKNKQRWDECIAFKARKDKWYKKVQEEFECFSCYELPLEPLTLPCAHNCCKKCMKQAFKNNYRECWTCRSKLDEEAEVNDFVNKDLKGIMNFLFPGYENAKRD